MYRLWRTRIFAVTWLAYAGFYLCRKNLSVVMPLLAHDLGYSNFQLATVIFSYSLYYTLGQFGFGILSDRFGSRLVVGIGLFVAIASNILMGVMASLAALVVLSCINGAAQATGWPGLVKNMAPWFARRERGVVMAWWTTNYVLGGFLATVFATYVATHPTILTQLGWRRGFWGPALLLVPVALVYVVFSRNQPSDAGLPEIEATLPAAKTLQQSAAGFVRALADPTVRIIAAGCFFAKVIRYAFLFWLPLYLTQSLGYRPDEAGYTSSLFEFVGFFGALIAGYASDKLMQSRRLPVAALMLWGLALVCWIHPILAARGMWRSRSVSPSSGS